MRSRSTNEFPRWLIFTVAALLVISGYFIVRGFLSFVDAGGNIISPDMTSTAAYNARVEKITRQFLSTLDFTNITRIALTPTQACMQYRVRVVKARVRDCPRDTCDTIAFFNEGNIVCVYSTAPDDPDWYQVIVDPADPFPETGYMHNSVLIAIKSNNTATPTLDIATVTPLPVTSSLSPVVPVGSVEAPTKAPMSETSTPTPTQPTPSNTPSVTTTPTQRPVAPPGS